LPAILDRKAIDRGRESQCTPQCAGCWKPTTGKQCDEETVVEVTWSDRRCAEDDVSLQTTENFSILLPICASDRESARPMFRLAAQILLILCVGHTYSAENM
jgi:hypothetical protein